MQNDLVWDDLVNKYSLSKTLRFELKPVGKTLDFIKESKLIEEDKQREADFNDVKKIMDDYYKDFIERVLNSVIIEPSDLEYFRHVYENLKKDKYNVDLQKKYFNIQKKLREQIYDQIKTNPDFTNLFKKELISELLPSWLKENEKLDQLENVLKFSGWTTYFTGFFENRKNVFSEKDISTSIIYRVINDNLPKYIDNLSKIDKILALNDFDYSEIETKYSVELSNKKLINFFSLNNFNCFLNQRGIDIYNLIIGGKSVENKKIQGLNELINLYSQKAENKEIQKSIKHLKLIPLFKQILSDRESFSDKYEQLNNNKEVIENIGVFYNLLIKEEIFNKLKNIINSIDQSDFSQIYIKNDSNLTTISQGLFKDYSKIKLGLREYAITEKNLKTDKKIDLFLKQKYFSISEIEQGLKLIGLNKSISEYFKSFKLDDKDIFSEITDAYDKFKSIEYDPNGDRFDIGEETEKGDLIKQFLDSIMDLLHFIKPLYVSLKNKTIDDEDEKKSEAYELDASFYSEFNEIYEKLSELIKIYNQTRNYITKKPFVTKKFKLNFNCSSFLTGWGTGFTTNSAIIFRKSDNDKFFYYLGIVPQNLSFEDKEKLFLVSNCENVIKWVYYDFQKPDNKNIPRLFIRSKGDSFAPAVEKYNLPIEDILEIYDNGYFKTEYKKTNFVKFKNSLIKLIDYFKLGFENHESYKHFNFKWKESKEYNDISEFYLDVIGTCYNLKFIDVNFNNLIELVENKKIYLFQIYNKDYSKYSKGKKNLHTIYWEELFSKENLKNVVYKLNGEAELFYREKSLPVKITHPKNQNIDNKDPINNKKTSCFDYDLIKDKRYTEDKFLFHCPITLNFKKKDIKSINNEVNKIIKSSEVNILSIDRGERNLLYYTLLDSNGNILLQNSFNSVFDDLNRKSDYKDKLDSIEGERKAARKNWHKIINIKELKEGYLSQVIYKISKIAVENNAVIVLEDLNYGFKKGRFKIEKQVYQKFEKMLIDKLNYLVFKEKDPEEIGGSLKAYQLTSKFDSFKKLGKQSGIIFYVPASYTSKICPKTGFINFIYPKFENIKQAQDLLSKFKYIKFHLNEDVFEFNFNYSDFKSKNDKTKLIKDNWSIWSNGVKLVQFRNSEKNNMWDTKEVNVTEELKKLFDNQRINYKDINNLKDQIVNVDSKEFLEKLIANLKLILQLRNSRSNSDEDYILSCVKGKDGKFFDSRSAKDNEPKDADANGAYHIGLKGLMIIDKIKEQESDKKIDLKIQNNDYINERIKRCN